MNWNFYRAFITVYEVGSINKASDTLTIKRETVQKSIKALEKQLNAKLFTSNAKGMTPTSAGIELYKKIEPLIAAIVISEKDLSEFDENSSALIKIAMPSTTASIGLKEFFGLFCKKYPNIQFEFFKRDTLDLLQKKKIDFIIDIEHIFRQHTFNQLNLFQEEHILIASKNFYENNKLQPLITKEQLLKLPLIIHKDFIPELTNVLNANIQPYMATISTEMVLSMVQKDLGVGFYFARVLGNIQSNDNIKILQLKNGYSFPTVNTVIAYNNGYLSRASRLFLKELNNFCKTQYSTPLSVSTF